MVRRDDLPGERGLRGDAEDDRRRGCLGPLERLRPRVADGEQRARAVGAPPERHEHVARLTVDADALDAGELFGDVDALEHPRRRDEEARDGAADPWFVPTWH